MPWQEQVADVALELDDDGTFAYDELNLTIPRQSGKTTLVLAVAVHRLTAMAGVHGPQRLTYTAQKRDKARLKLERDFAVTLRASGTFREVAHARARPSRSTEWRLSLNNGSETIQFGVGSYLQIDTPSRTGGHGDTLDVGVIDEAFAHEDDTIESGMEPSMATRQDHQLIVLSTAGDDRSKYLWRKVLAGRAATESGDHGRTAYFEWSAPDDSDPGDPETWRGCSPALGLTITERFLEGQWEKAQRGGQEGIDKFRRAYLNQWPQVPLLVEDLGWRVIPTGLWRERADPSHQPQEIQAHAVDVDVNAKGETWSSVGVFDGSHGWLVNPPEQGPGTMWVVPSFVAKGVHEVALDQSGPAAALIGEFERAGITVHKIKPAEMAQASKQMFDALIESQFHHLDQQAVNVAAAGAEKRDVGDGMWRWSRNRSAVDIGPIVALSLARYAALSGPAYEGPLVAVT